MILDERQRLSAVNLADRVRRSTTNPDVITLCDLVFKLLPLTKPPPAVQLANIARKHVTKNPPARRVPPTLIKSPAKSVTKDPARKKRGRPPSPNAKTPAQRAKAYRERKKAPTSPAKEQPP